MVYSLSRGNIEHLWKKKNKKNARGSLKKTQNRPLFWVLPRVGFLGLPTLAVTHCISAEPL